jgi:hypothetical protein
LCHVISAYILRCLLPFLTGSMWALWKSNKAAVSIEAFQDNDWDDADWEILERLDNRSNNPTGTPSPRTASNLFSPPYKTSHRSNLAVDLSGNRIRSTKDDATSPPNTSLSSFLGEVSSPQSPPPGPTITTKTAATTTTTAATTARLDSADDDHETTFLSTAVCGGAAFTGGWLFSKMDGTAIADRIMASITSACIADINIHMA